MSRVACFAILSSLLWILDSKTLDPVSVIKSVSSATFSNDNSTCVFISWQYGTSYSFHSMFYATQHVNGLDYEKEVSPHLDRLIYNDTTSAGYRILHNISIAFTSHDERAVGDVVGLFPYVYLDRLMYNDARNIPYPSRSDDLKLILKTTDFYILQYPRRLTDGTFARDEHGHWNQTDKNASFAWADDNYMGLLLLTHFAKHFIHSSDPQMSSRASNYAQYVADMHLKYISHLTYKDGSNRTDLFSHGYNENGRVQSCCPWGRGNAWTVVSAVEALEMLKLFPEMSVKRQVILESYQKRCRAIAKLQDQKSGRWHQVLTLNWTFLETSASSGFLSAIARGKMNGYLKNGDVNYDDVIQKAWNGLGDVIDTKTGKYQDLCIGTGIGNDASYYENISTDYCRSGDEGGPGWIVQAAVDYMRYKQHVAGGVESL